MVVEKCAEVLYKIQPIPEGEKDAMVVHVGRLKPYFPPIDLEDDPASPPPYFEEDGDEAGEQILLNSRRWAKPPNPRVDPSYDDDREGGRPLNAPGGPPPSPPDIDPVDFPLPVTPPPRSPVLERTPRRELSERRREERRERDQSCKPSGSGTQRNDAQQRADR